MSIHSSNLGPFMEDIISEFEDVYNSNSAFQNDGEYLRLMEYRFLVKNTRELTAIQLYQSNARSETTTKDIAGGNSSSKVPLKATETRTDAVLLIERKKYLDTLLSAISDKISERLQVTVANNINSRPKILELCEKLKFSKEESNLFHLMVVVQGSTNSYVLNSLLEDDYYKRIIGYQRVCGISEVGIEIFCDGERQHIKEGLVFVDEDNGTNFNLRAPRTAVQIFYGREVSDGDLLKVSATALETIMLSSASSEAIAEDAAQDVPSKRRRSSGTSSRLNSGATSNVRHLSKKSRRSGESPRKVEEDVLMNSLLRELLTNQDENSADESRDEAHDDGLDQEGGVNEGLPHAISTSSMHSVGEDVSDGNTNDINPYPIDNQLEYLEECFQVVALMVRGNAARLKDELKQEGTRFTSWEGGDVKHGKRELLAKLRLAEKKVAKRIEVTKNSSVDLPRLEVLSSRLGLDYFERTLIILLIGKTVCPMVKALMESLDGTTRTIEESISVGQALAILCQDFQTQVANRKYFYRSGRLSTNGIISLNKSRWHQGSGDLTDQKISLDRRVLDWAVGLDSEINELVEGSDLYKPKVCLSQVVLPDGQLNSLLSQCKAYDTFRKYRVEKGLEDILSYGNGLVTMLCGKSGTGKTMTVNAVAKELGKNVLLVDFGSLTGKKEGADIDADLKGLFREAQMSNCVLFFDECEVVFRNRDKGGDRMLNSLLTEIERHEGIVFLATNRPYELDEAMHRRITSVVKFRAPDHLMRCQIWTRLLGIQCKQGSTKEDANPAAEGAAKLSLDDDVDIAALAIKYELTGGFIKNAVISALLSAIARNSTSTTINQQDLMLGCRLQMRGALSRGGSDVQCIPHVGLNGLELIPLIRKTADAVIRHEKARACVYGSWGYDPEEASFGRGASANDQRACICCLAGPSGSGKQSVMKSIAYDLGRPVNLVHISDIASSSNVSETVKKLESLMHDSQLGDAVIAIDGFEHILDENAAAAGEGGWKLHLLLSRILEVLHQFPGCVILLCHMDSPQNITLQKDFASKLYCFIRFTTPAADVRGRLWKRLMPSKAPVAKDINYLELGRRFDLNAGSIRSAIARAASEAAMRMPMMTSSAPANEVSTEVHGLSHKDLLAAGEVEVNKLKSGNFEVMSSLFA